MPGNGSSLLVPSRSSACFCLEQRLELVEVLGLLPLRDRVRRRRTLDGVPAGPRRPAGRTRRRAGRGRRPRAGRRATPGASGTSSSPNSSRCLSAAIFSSLARMPSRRAPSLRSAISRVVELGIRPCAAAELHDLQERPLQPVGRGDLLRLLRRVEQAIEVVVEERLDAGRERRRRPDRCRRSPLMLRPPSAVARCSASCCCLACCRNSSASAYRFSVGSSARTSGLRPLTLAQCLDLREQRAAPPPR